MADDTRQDPPGHHPETCIPLREYFEALRAGDDRLSSANERWLAERDRRYAEVKNAEEKALKVKEAADEKALDLASQIQAYKDEKANELRSQIERERGTYATQGDLKGVTEKFEALLKPIAEFVSAQQGRHAGSSDARLNINTVMQVLAFLAAAAIVYATFHK